MLASLLFPLLWIAGLAIAGSVAVRFGWPSHWIRIAIHLLAAWIAIRSFSMLVREPVWARAVVIAAYSIAVLAILHLLDPTLIFLDRLAIQIGNLQAVAAERAQEHVLFRHHAVGGGADLAGAGAAPATPAQPDPIGAGAVRQAAQGWADHSGGGGILGQFRHRLHRAGAVQRGARRRPGLRPATDHFNLISGVLLLMDKSIKPGDVIQIGGTYGWVASLGARYVSIETRDGTEYLVPNEEIITHQVINWSHRNDLARLKVQVRVAYDADVRKALELMAEGAQRPARVLSDPAPRALLLEFGESFMLLELRFWIHDVYNGIRNISSEVMLEILDLFREHGIAIPMPQQGIHINAMPPLTVNLEPPRPAA